MNYAHRNLWISILVISAIVATIFAGLYFGGERFLSQQFMFGTLVVSTIAFVVSLIVVCVIFSIPDKAPDLIRTLFDKKQIFECGGVSFAFFSDVDPDLKVYLLRIVSQNRFSGPAQMSLVLTPDHAANNAPIPRDLIIQVPGGGITMTTILANFPPPLLDKYLVWSMYGETRYPQGKTLLLRNKEGHKIGSITQIAETAKSIGMLLMGHIHWTTPAKFIVTVPAGVEPPPFPQTTIVTQLMWDYENPTPGLAAPENIHQLTIRILKEQGKLVAAEQAASNETA